MDLHPSPVRGSSPRLSGHLSRATHACHYVEASCSGHMRSRLVHNKQLRNACVQGECPPPWQLMLRNCTGVHSCPILCHVAWSRLSRMFARTLTLCMATSNMLLMRSQTADVGKLCSVHAVLALFHTAANQAAAVSLHVAANACRQDGCSAQVCSQAISDLCVWLQVFQRALRTLSAKLRVLYNLAASLIAWIANPCSGGPYWCHFPSGFAEWAVFIYGISIVWCIMVRNTLAKFFESPAGDDLCTDYHVSCHALS